MMPHDVNLALDALCWSEKGIWGDRSCAELARVGGCQQCESYRKAGHRLFHRAAPSEYRAEWSRILAQQEQKDAARLLPYFVFRIGASWLGMQVGYLMEASPPVTIRTLPHRRSELLLGLTAIRGEILPCVSLHALLGEQVVSIRRYLVMRFREGRWVIPADEVMGVQELAAESMQPLPANMANADVVFTKGILLCQEQQVGLLDEELLFGTIERRIA